MITEHDSKVRADANQLYWLIVEEEAHRPCNLNAENPAFAAVNCTARRLATIATIVEMQGELLKDENAALRKRLIPDGIPAA